MFDFDWEEKRRSIEKNSRSIDKGLKESSRSEVVRNVSSSLQCDKSAPIKCQFSLTVIQNVSFHEFSLIFFFPNHFLSCGNPDLTGKYNKGDIGRLDVRHELRTR